jgi:hypothetical protein
LSGNRADEQWIYAWTQDRYRKINTEAKFLIPDCAALDCSQLPDHQNSLMAARAIPLSACRLGLGIKCGKQICGLSLKTEKIRLLWYMRKLITLFTHYGIYFWLELAYVFPHNENSYQSHVAIRLLFFDFWLAIAIWTVAWHSLIPGKDK